MIGTSMTGAAGPIQAGGAAIAAAMQGAAGQIAGAGASAAAGIAASGRAATPRSGGGTAVAGGPTGEQSAV